MPLTNPQQTIFDDPARVKVCAAGRRFGKTFLSMWEIARVARHPNKRIMYVSPTYKMSKNIMWDEIKNRMLDKRWARKVNESDLSIVLVNGSKITLASADNPDSLRGLSLDLAILDEAAYMNAKTYYEVIRPALSDRQGNCVLISTPNGYDWFHDLWTQAHTAQDHSAFQFTTLEGGNVPPEEVEFARQTLDLKTFQQEYQATFESASNNIYYAFDINHTVKAWDLPTPQTLHIGQDFNIDPGSAVVFAKTESGLHVIDELIIPNSNTDEMAQAIRERYPESRIISYPDPAGAARKTSAGGKTDHTILRQYGFDIRTRKSHPAIKDRINSVNRLLCDAAGNRRLFVDPACKRTIEGLQKHAYKAGTNLPDKSSGYDHTMDALGYCVEYLFPIRTEVDKSRLSRAYGI